MSVTQDDERIVVDTGHIRFTVGKKVFNGIEITWFSTPPSIRRRTDSTRPAIAT